MPYKYGTALNFNDLISQIIEWTTDEQIHGEDAWQLMRNLSYPNGTILKAHGRAKGEIQYLGLMPFNIVKGSTYKNWFFTKKVLAQEFVWKYFAPYRDFTFSSAASNIRLYNEDRSELLDYTINLHSPTAGIDIFTTSCNALYFGVFKQYSAGLQWHEQAGAPDFSNLTLRRLWYKLSTNTSPSWGTAFNPPPMPGVGFPAFGMPATFPAYGFEYWLVKSRTNLIIVIRDVDQWQYAQLGQLETYDNGEYGFPACIVGGMSGLIEWGANERPTGVSSATPQAAIGLMFNYLPSSQWFSNGIPPYATIPGTVSEWKPSQVLLQLPDGTWHNVANFNQVLSTVNNNFCGGNVTQLYYKLNAPNRIKNGYYYHMRPLEIGDSQDKYYTYDTRTTPNEVRYLLDPLDIYRHDTYEKIDYFGRLWRTTYPSCPVRIYGEYIIDGKKHLFIPNGWENRKHLNQRIGIYTETNLDSLLATQRAEDRWARQMNIVVQLED